METYIATFFSHFGAIRFNKKLKAMGVNGTLMPVPRKVSSSCGTCVRFEAADLPILSEEDVEHLFRQTDGGYEMIFSNI